MIGDKIKSKRIELGWTQEELAERMGYKSKSTINKIELNINDIPLSKVQEFAKVLCVSPAYLMDWVPSNNPTPPTPYKLAEENQSGVRAELISKLPDLSDPQVELLNQMADNMQK